MAAAPDLQIVREAPVGFDLLRTLGTSSVGRRDPALRIDRGVVRRTTHPVRGSAPWRAQATDRGIHPSAWGERTGWVVDHHAARLGAVDRPEAFVTDHAIVDDARMLQLEPFAGHRWHVIGRPRRPGRPRRGPRRGMRPLPRARG